MYTRMLARSLPAFITLDDCTLPAFYCNGTGYNEDKRQKEKKYLAGIVDYLLYGQRVDESC